METIDINVTKTVDSVNITVTPNLTTVNINSVTGLGNSATDIETQAGLIDDKYVSPLKLKNWFTYIKTLAQNISGYWSFTSGLFADFIQFNLATSIDGAVGRLKWNDTDGTLDLGLKGGNVTLQIGQETIARVVNKTLTNISLLESNYQVVRVTGAIGGRPKVDLALANNDLNSTTTLGLVTETILNNQEGFVTTSGQVKGINTTGSLQGETWLDGDILYLSGTIAGRATNIKPAAPIHTVVLGFVEYAHINNGKIFVKVDNGYELEELHNVSAIAPLNEQVLTYETSTALWKPKDKRTYKVYNALLTQSGTSIPVATVLENTLGGTPVWNISADGVYSATLAGAFPIAKTLILSANVKDYTDHVKFLVNPSNFVLIYTTKNGVPSNNVLTNCPIEIRVYN